MFYLQKWWNAVPSQYDYRCSGEMTLEDYRVTYCLAEDESGIPVLAVRMKFPPRKEENGDNIMIKIEGADGTPNATYLGGFDASGKPVQSWYIFTCANFTQHQIVHDDPGFWKRRVIDLVWKRYLRDYRNLFPRNDYPGAVNLIGILNMIEGLAKGRFETRWRNDSNDGLYKGELHEQSQICNQ